MLSRSLSFGLALLLAATPLCAQHEHHHDSDADQVPPLYPNLGTLHRMIHTASPKAQQYFDQGLRLTYAFNHAEAVRAFQYAIQLDSSCAMCWWGVANALGPNINMPMDSSAVAPAAAAMERAKSLAARESPANRALIEAQAARYVAQPPADRSPLDSAYATKLRSAVKRFPADPDIGALFGEAMLDLRPWNQWKKDGTPQPGTTEAVAALERVIAKDPNHPGACHFYIHAVEGSSTPERALPCAERLATLMPGAGHLVHMPAHIALRLGRYQQAINHNQHAVHADEAYADGPHVESIYGLVYTPHNWHFLSVAAAFAGQGKLAIEAAYQTRNGVPIDVAKQVPPLEFWLTVPYFALVRFGKWQDLLEEPAPDSALHYVTAMWHYGRGMARAATGSLQAAHADADELAAIRAVMPGDFIVSIHPAVTLLGMAEENLRGTIAAREGKDTEAIQHFEKAVAFDQSLSYDEPPPAYTPPRQFLGMELLRQEKPEEAAEVFRADLKNYRENGWALLGLKLALTQAHHAREAALVDARLKRAWAKADVGVDEVRF